MTDADATALREAAGGPVVVTGATGFVGRHVCDALAAAGVDVRRALRRPASVARRGDVVVGDVAAAPRWEDALRGAAAVVHLAARVHVLRERDTDPAGAFERANVAATEALLRAAAEHGVRRVVFASSVKAIAEHADHPLREDEAPRPEDAYGRSKLAAEHAVLAWAVAGRESVVLRLPLVYGPGVGGNVRRLFRMVDRGLPVPVPTVANARSLANVRNVADAFVAAATAERDGGGVYHVADARPVSTAELVLGVARALGRRARIVPLPGLACRVAGRIGDALAAVGPWPATSADLARLTGSLVLDASKLERDYGVRPVHTLSDGLAETAAWYRAARSGEAAA